MKLWETFRFEVAYQSRRVSTWFYFVLLLVISFFMAREVFVAEAREGSCFLNAPDVEAGDNLAEVARGGGASPGQN